MIVFHGFSGQQKTTQKCVVLRKPWLLCILITIYIFHNATIFTALHTHCTTQASVNSRRTPTSYAYTRIRSCKRIGHQYEYTQSHRVINCAFDQTNTFYLFVCLLLVYSFSPRAQSIQRGPLDNAAMFFYAAIVLCASTRQNGIKKTIAYVRWRWWD